MKKNHSQPKASEEKPNNEKPINFITEFRHWRSGEVLRAEDYGIKAFPIPIKKG
uniref:Uncharacterized protein n=1 Tax=Desulfovibrio desulfuricans (strain ATCC 27774 / DSM 6949 / MB) TaxID=525146 RepID=B8J310_DESDA